MDCAPSRISVRAGRTSAFRLLRSILGYRRIAQPVKARQKLERSHFLCRVPCPVVVPVRFHGAKHAGSPRFASSRHPCRRQAQKGRSFEPALQSDRVHKRCCSGSVVILPGPAKDWFQANSHVPASTGIWSLASSPWAKAPVCSSAIRAASRSLQSMACV